MIIENFKDVEKFVRESTIEEQRKVLINGIGRSKNKLELIIFLKGYIEMLDRRIDDEPKGYTKAKEALKRLRLRN